MTVWFQYINDNHFNGELDLKTKKLFEKELQDQAGGPLPKLEELETGGNTDPLPQLKELETDDNADPLP